MSTVWDRERRGHHASIVTRSPAGEMLRRRRTSGARHAGMSMKSPTIMKYTPKFRPPRVKSSRTASRHEDPVATTCQICSAIGAETTAMLAHRAGAPGRSDHSVMVTRPLRRFRTRSLCGNPFGVSVPSRCPYSLEARARKSVFVSRSCIVLREVGRTGGLTVPHSGHVRVGSAPRS